MTASLGRFCYAAFRKAFDTYRINELFGDLKSDWVFSSYS